MPENEDDFKKGMEALAKLGEHMNFSSKLILAEKELFEVLITKQKRAVVFLTKDGNVGVMEDE